MTNQTPSSDDRVATYLALTGALPGTRLEWLPGDASTRRYVRVMPPSDRSRILLVHPEAIDPKSLPFLNVGRLINQMGIRTPAVTGCTANLGIVELEDLGNLTLQGFLIGATPNERATRYREAVAIIATMQRQGHKLDSSDYAPFRLAFDVDKLMWELNFFVDHFLVNARGTTLNTPQRAELNNEFRPLATELASEPRVFCHRDYHSRNLMVHKDHLYVIDFQDARMGPDTYDLVALLMDSYVDNPTALIETMIDEYLQLSGTSDAEDFRRRFDIMSVQRQLKALGTFGYQSTTAGTTRYEGDIPRTLRSLTTVFNRHSRFDRLRTLLSVHVTELG
jgi:aminoglycoside/choline kinase family phosphotransferase